MDPQELQLLARTFGVSAFSWMFVHPPRVHKQLAPGQVEAINTSLTRKQARAALQAGFRTTQGRAPSEAELNMLVAQSALETAFWSKMWNWNWGNITTTGEPWFTLVEKTRLHYRPFKSAADGAAYYVSFVKRHYPEAWEVLGSGDTQAFAQALHDRGYYGGAHATPEEDIAGYAAGLDSLYAKV